MDYEPLQAYEDRADEFHDGQSLNDYLVPIRLGEKCPACGNVRGVPNPLRFACSDCWDALPPVVRSILRRERGRHS